MRRRRCIKLIFDAPCLSSLGRSCVLNISSQRKLTSRVGSIRVLEKGISSDPQQFNCLNKTIIIITLNFVKKNIKLNCSRPGIWPNRAHNIGTFEYLHVWRFSKHSKIQTFKCSGHSRTPVFESRRTCLSKTSFPPALQCFGHLLAQMQMSRTRP